jgi:O-acetyl-ADP-ribose deacetylase (regulator of RNase III)
LEVDAIVNATDERMSGGGGVDLAIHRAAGPELSEECKKLGGCKTGEAKITKGYNLPAKYVIHTVGPVYGKENGNEAKLLADCYGNCLKLARKKGIRTIAFPAISTGAYGYPNQKAAHIAVKIICAFLVKNEKSFDKIIFTAFDADDKNTYELICCDPFLLLCNDVDLLMQHGINFAKTALMIQKVQNETHKYDHNYAFHLLASQSIELMFKSIIAANIVNKYKFENGAIIRERINKKIKKLGHDLAQIINSEEITDSKKRLGMEAHRLDTGWTDTFRFKVNNIDREFGIKYIGGIRYGLLAQNIDIAVPYLENDLICNFIEKIILECNNYFNNVCQKLR